MKYGKCAGDSNIEKAVHEYLKGTTSSFEVAKKYNMERSRTYIWTWIRRHDKGKTSDPTLQHGGTAEHNASNLPDGTTSSMKNESLGKSDNVVSPAEANKDHAARPPLVFLDELKAKISSINSKPNIENTYTPSANVCTTLNTKCVEMGEFIKHIHKEKIEQN
jgi:hypothetical protein